MYKLGLAAFLVTLEFLLARFTNLDMITGCPRGATRGTDTLPLVAHRQPVVLRGAPSGNGGFVDPLHGVPTVRPAAGCDRGWPLFHGSVSVARW